MLSAYRAETLWLRLLVAALAILLTLAGWIAGKEPWAKPLRPEGPRPAPVRFDVPGWVDRHSDTAQVRRALDKGALLVAYGTELEPAEFRLLEEMLTTRACREMDGLLRDELLTLRRSLRAALYRHMITEADRVMEGLGEDRLLEALRASVSKGQPIRIRIDEFAAEVGFARYRQWRTHWQLLPVEDSTREEPFHVRLDERRQSLPPTRQAYLRLLLNGEPGER